MKIITSHGDEYDLFRNAMATYCDALMEGADLFFNQGSNERERNMVIRMPGNGPRIRVTLERIKFNLLDKLKWREKDKLTELQFALLDCNMVYNEHDDILHLMPQGLDAFGTSDRDLLNRAMYFFTIIQYALKVVIFDPAEDNE